MKKALIYLCLFFAVFSFLNFNRAYAASDEFEFVRNTYEKNYNESFEKINKYNVRKLTYKDILFNNNESVLRFFKDHQNVKNSFNPLTMFWPAICDTNKNKSYLESQVELLNEACSVRQRKSDAPFIASKSVMSFVQMKDNSPSASILLYKGDKNLTFSFDESGFYSEELSDSDLNDFYIINVQVDPYESYKKTKRFNMIQMTIGKGRDYIYTKGNRVFGLMGKNNNFYYSAYYNEFNVVYPSGFPTEDKPKQSFEKALDSINKSKFYPYMSYKVSKYNLNGTIVGVDDRGKTPFQVTQIRAVFELYKENKTDFMFKYVGDSLLDHFNYDFDEKGVYYVKTYVQAKPPLLGFGEKVEVVQPVWTKVVINGSSYSVVNTSENSFGQCSGDSCDAPAYVHDCVALSDSNFGEYIRCSFDRVDTNARSQFGALYSPVRFVQQIVNSFSVLSSVSCNFRLNNTDVSVCFLQQKMPRIYTILVVLSNGVVLFGFSMYLYSQAVHFFAGDGGDD